MAQQADALVAVAKAYLARTGRRAESNGEAVPGGEDDAVSNGNIAARDTDTAPSGTGVADHYQIVVHVDEKALRGGAGKSDLPLPTIERLTCDCSLILLVEDEQGNPLALGRKTRNLSTSLRRLIWARDRHCTFPGCTRKCYVDCHHIKHWAHGGESEPDNLTLLCYHHHVLLHEGRFSIRKLDDGSLEFLRPDGRVIPRSGYLREDIVDDCDDYGNDDNVWVEAYTSVEGSYGPDAVREARPAYGAIVSLPS